MEWNEKNQLVNEDDNVLATVEWDTESQSWAYDNMLTLCGEAEIPTMEEAMKKAEDSVKDTLSERKDDSPVNPSDTIFNLGLYGMF